MGKVEIINAIEDAGFDAELIQSGQQDKLSILIMGLLTVDDAKFVEDILYNMKGVREFVVDSLLAKSDILFDPEVIGLRSIADAIESEGDGRFKVILHNPYTTYFSSRMDESSQMFRLFTSSLTFSVRLFSHFVNIVVLSRNPFELLAY